MKKTKLEDLDLTKIYSAPKSRKQRLEEIASTKKLQNEEVSKEEAKEEAPKEILKESVVEDVNDEGLEEESVEEITAELPSQKKKKRPLGPEIQICGHWNWYSKAQHEQAAEENKCCPGAGINGRPRVSPPVKIGF